MEYVKKFFVLVGLFLVSQIGMTAFSVVKIISQGMGETNLSLFVSILLILLVIGNIWLLIFLGKN